MLPSSSEIQYFVEVASTLNISRAAERLGISQPSSSLAIRRLEDTVGTPLLMRNKGGVQLTRAGEKFALQARGLLEEWERLRSSAVRGDQEISGRFTIGCHPSVALYSLPHVLPELLMKHAGLEISLQHDWSRKITESVISFKTDFGIVVNPVRHPDLVIKQLVTDEVGFWVGPKKNTLNDLKSPSAVVISDPDLLQSQALLKGLKKLKIEFSRSISSSNLEVVAGLTASGAGVGILPERVASRVGALGLKKAGTHMPTFKDEICLIYRADAQKSAAARAIIEASQQIFR